MLQPSTHHVFMSYSRKDEIIMRRIVTFLRKQGFKVWVDNEKLVPGTPIWEEEIEKAIKGSSAIIVMLSPDSQASEWVRREISFGEQYHKRIFPVLVSGDEDSSMTLRLITRQYVDIRKNEDIGLNSLSAALLFYLEELEVQEQNRRKIEQEALEKAIHEKAEREAFEREVTEKAAREAAEKAEREALRLKAERQAAELAAREAVEKAAQEKIEREATERAATRKAEQDAIELAARKKAEREQAEQAEIERKTREDAEKLAIQKAEKEHQAKRKLEAEQLAEEKAEAERIAKNKLEAERLAEEKENAELVKHKADKEHILKIRATTEKKQEELVYIIADQGTPLYKSLPASNNWSIWLEKGSKVTVIEPEKGRKNIGKYGLYVEVFDEHGNKGYITGTSAGIDSITEKMVTPEELAKQKADEERKTSESREANNANQKIKRKTEDAHIAQEKSEDDFEIGIITFYKKKAELIAAEQLAKQKAKKSL